MLTTRWHAAIVLLALLAASPLQAQDGVRYGFKFGVTSITLLGEPDAPGGGEFNAGGFATLPLRGALSALVSADYHRHAGSGFGFRHLSLSLAPQYHVALGHSRVALYGFVGPRLDVSEDDEYEDVILGGSLAVGFELTESYVGPLLIEMRYDFDATPARRLDWINPTLADQRFRRLSLRLGFSF
jgi:hypothetical protein